MKRFIQPFEEISKSQRLIILSAWFVLILLLWVISSMGTKHLFPSIPQVMDGFKSLFEEGLIVHLFSSLGLFFKSLCIAIIVSLVIVYLSPIPLLKPVANILSKLRFLPLTGLTYYMSIYLKDARSMQVGVLVVFMSVYFITSLISVLKDVPQDEIDHARSLKCTRWEILWEVIIKGRLDYVIDVLRQNMAIIWMMLVTVESILVAAGGLGVLIKNSDKFMNHGRIIALQIIILLVGLALDWVLNTSRKALFRYSTF